MKKIRGVIVRHPFEDGVYGIEDAQGNQYLPVVMPDQLKSEGKKVACIARDSDMVSYIMWGQPIEIISFET